MYVLNHYIAGQTRNQRWANDNIFGNKKLQYKKKQI